MAIQARETGSGRPASVQTASAEQLTPLQPFLYNTNIISPEPFSPHCFMIFSSHFIHDTLVTFVTASWHHAALLVEQRPESRLREGEASEGAVQLQQECPVRVPSQASGHGLGPAPQGRIILTLSHIDNIFFPPFVTIKAFMKRSSWSHS